MAVSRAIDNTAIVMSVGALSGLCVDLEIPSCQLELVELGGERKGMVVSFPITRFGSYLVAVESER